MATNPRIPQDDHTHMTLQPKSKVPWVLIAIIVAAAILVALILWLPRTPRQQIPPSGAQVPAQPTGDQIQFTNLNLTPAPTGGAYYLQGRMVNMGSSEITGVAVDASFQGINGQTLETIRVPVVGVVGNGNTTTQPLTEAPIKPDQARIVRMEFTHVPEGWNKQLPELKVVTVTAAGTPVSPAGQPPILNEQDTQNSQSGKNPPQNGATNSGQLENSPHHKAGAGEPVKGHKPQTEIPH